jgi:uncharacterized membrane protein YadS
LEDRSIVADDNAPSPSNSQSRTAWIRSEDWLAVWLGGAMLLLAFGGAWWGRAEQFATKVAELDALESELASLDDQGASGKSREQAEKAWESQAKSLVVSRFKPWLAKIGEWEDDPRTAFFARRKPEPGGPAVCSPATGGQAPLTDWNKPLTAGLAGTFLVSATLFAVGIFLHGGRPGSFLLAFVPLFLLAIVSYVLAGQSLIKSANLEYALWAIVLGMLVANTLGTPAWLRPALRTELYIKTGLVLLGAEILFSRLLVLGLPGVFVSWVVTPIVLITTYLFGQYVLRMPSRSLNMVIAADMSVCGVSAAIATAAACKAKKEELSLAISLSLVFTVVMMVVMPMVIRAAGMSEVLGGAWLGGTIDSTGAVTAAGDMLGPVALEVAVTVKMIQNILIGVVAFGVAVYWVTCVEPRDDTQRPGWGEIWLRFPKFVLGFVAASLVFSTLYSSGTAGKLLAEATLAGGTELLRGWFFCLAFVSIGLESNFRELATHMRGGKPLVLYLCGQALNLLLTFLMAWLMFTVVFPSAATELAK